VAATRAERFSEFVRRLNEAPSASSADNALALLTSILNEVEDELAGVPYDPARWQTDGRLYPPQADSRRTVADRTDVVRYRSRAHNTYIAENGAIEIVAISGEVILRKTGADGRHVWDIDRPSKN
jgi:hypothetical protein